MGDHTECFQVDFDPSVITYPELLEHFWQAHDPSRPAYSAQYASVILAPDEASAAWACTSRDRFEAVIGRPVLTRIDVLGSFHVAEDYHQKYYLRSRKDLYNSLRSSYADEAEFRDSPTTMRVNGYLSGGPGPRALERELGELGLSSQSESLLRAAVHPTRRLSLD